MFRREICSRGCASIARGDAPTKVLARFDKPKGELPEGLWRSGTTNIVALSPAASLVDVDATGLVTTLKTLGAAANTFTLGIVGSADGTLYVGVGAAAAVGGAAADALPVSPAPGVYAIGTDGGVRTFSDGRCAVPPMRFANGLAFRGNDLFVADSEGAIYTIDPGGTATVWSADPLLAPSQRACGGIVPLAVGANGLVIDADAAYVTNTNFGRVLRIPIDRNGAAGTPFVVAEDCALLAGADGLVEDADGSFLVAVNAQNRIARVTRAGAIMVVASGPPLDTPASLVIDADNRQLVVTTSSFFSAADAGPLRSSHSHYPDLVCYFQTLTGPAMSYGFFGGRLVAWRFCGRGRFVLGVGGAPSSRSPRSVIGVALVATLAGRTVGTAAGSCALSISVVTAAGRVVAVRRGPSWTRSAAPMPRRPTKAAPRRTKRSEPSFLTGNG